MRGLAPPPKLAFLKLYSVVLYCRFLQPLADTNKDHTDEKRYSVKCQRWNQLFDSGEPLHMCGDRHNDVDASADAGQKQ